MMSDFKEWWNAQEIMAGEGSMNAAEDAWDAQQEKIKRLEAENAALRRKVEQWKNIASGFCRN